MHARANADGGNFQPLSDPRRQAHRHLFQHHGKGPRRLHRQRIFARLVVSKPEHEERCRSMGITDVRRVYRARDLAPGKRIIFAATGVTDFRVNAAKARLSPEDTGFFD